jgi:hypothetical protein
MLTAVRAVVLGLAASIAACATDLAEAGDEAEIEAEDTASTSDFRAMPPCGSPSDYVPAGLIQFGLTRDSYTPPCARLATGGYVLFEGSLEEHPLIPRSSGTSPSPIQPSSDGSSVAFDFFDAGFFPYQCAAHPEEIGVIWATWY